MRDVVKFDDWDPVTRQLVDRKLNVTGHGKIVAQTKRQVAVAQQYVVGVRWELPEHRIGAANHVLKSAGVVSQITLKGVPK